MSKARIGVYGLGTMGSALALNFASRGIPTAVCNREIDWIAPFLQEAGPLADHLSGAETLQAFVASLETPRLILMMIPSGAPIDAMIAQMQPLLDAGDTLIDAGNADFNDTRRRSSDFAGTGLHFVGMGVSGGEEGARTGPSMMVGGSEHSWAQLRPVLEPIAAEFQGLPCVAHVGPDGAGHFVKTVHNGIEYADMQMIAEVYGLLRDHAGMPAADIGAVLAGWNDGPLSSYLIETTAKVLQTIDPETGKPLVDLIQDQAGQKGTGRWTLIEALKLGQSASTIEAAVGARAWSSAKEARVAAADVLPAGALDVVLPAPDVLAQALFAGRILAHIQGFEILRAASAEFTWALGLAEIAEIWRAGCIIRSSFLDDLAEMLRASGSEPVLLVPAVGELLTPILPALRQTVSAAMQAGLPMPAMAAALSWYDSARQARGTANLIQGQRDAFGAHGFRRVDHDGVHHGNWGA
ncbi:NADP-dependent phosphogluconate dehydrogenase [Falsiruegeria litorea]|uniref:6-phosphogluconate dehydrogenase, decarboxylating n=1 Tax=Falsiruegeria litorea TaxID=1280831 RepID=A0ABS5WUG9_9RHOB|nr:NADP-dependent phosphogluconate dehydrogenase [Falsiruegeria litorea]MBT3142742.1 NADP-dependent phosphogluconate dehydrogenase [Falsiruegeria litorea]MBT8168266.1 NADP-dependent phosphogluconate dehydrogenase [Falsiruegeria litorea]